MNPTVLQVRLTKRYAVAERTMAFEFEKPEGFTFKAGQLPHRLFLFYSNCRPEDAPFL